MVPGLESPRQEDYEFPASLVFRQLYFITTAYQEETQKQEPCVTPL